jgi:hypothetical protein
MESNSTYGESSAARFFRQGPNNITAIRILGERHSGTSYLTTYLQTCYPTLHITNRFLRNKHWFQPGPDYIEQSRTTNGRREFELLWPNVAGHVPVESAFHTTLVVALFRDPYDWMEGMRTLPHHWPCHWEYSERDTLRELPTNTKMMNKRRRGGKKKRHDSRATTDETPIKRPAFEGTPVSWQTFVQTPLSLPPGPTLAHTDRPYCQKGYGHGTVSPCDRGRRWVPESIRHRHGVVGLPGSGSDPVYELQLNGTPFAHPLALRHAKIENLLALPTRWSSLGGYFPMTYEVVNRLGTAFLLRTISAMTGVEAQCEPIVPKPNPLHRPLEKEFHEWITLHTNWATEAKVGYVPRDWVKGDKAIELEIADKDGSH